MGFRPLGIKRTSFATKLTSSNFDEVPKGYLAVHIGEEMKRFVIPISYLNQSAFQDLLSEVEEEFGFVHQMGALTISCREDVFLKVISSNGC
ncbi:hypothetical protein K1719_002006 [Acacia pycnantha]|nr:hypothetical protein K1719_002006 [Acacia pycnantha]